MLQIYLTRRQLCDLSMLLDGSFQPLDHFMTELEYNSVLETMSLPNGHMFPIPIVLDVSVAVSIGSQIGLIDEQQRLVAVMTVTSCWRPDKKKEAKLVYGTTDMFHCGVKRVFDGGVIYLGGTLQPREAIIHYHIPVDDQVFIRSAQDVKKMIQCKGYNQVVAFQTRNPMHRAHHFLTTQVMKNLISNKSSQFGRPLLLLHPTVGETKDGDVPVHLRIEAYKEILTKYNQCDFDVQISLLPLSMRMAGPREALLHALIRKNYGCTHFIVGRNHADPGLDKSGKPYYGAYDAQILLDALSTQIGIDIVPMKMVAYDTEEKEYVFINEPSILVGSSKYKTISGTALREMLCRGVTVPDWYTFPEIARVLTKTIRDKESKIQVQT